MPYGVSAEVSDGGPVYREEWLAGCFDDQLVAGHRLKVLLNFEHGLGISNVVGKGVELRSQPDGLHGSFRVLETQDGDKALSLVRDGILDGVSLEAYAKKSIHGRDGVIRRVKAHLHNVALCRQPAFVDALVLAVREEVIVDEELLLPDIDSELVDRCRELGIRLPQRLQAHPETDTPAQTGTSGESAPASDGNDQLRRCSHMAATQSELRLANLIDERELVRSKHESKLGEIESREDKTLTESDNQMLVGYRERAAQIDTEVSALADEIKRHNDSIEESKKIRRVLSGTAGEGIDADGDEVVYRTMAAYARDVILTGQGRESSRIAAQLGDKQEIERAKERLQLVKRTPANTLSSDVAGADPRAAHRADLPGHRHVAADRGLGDAGGARARRAQLPAHRQRPDRRRAGSGEDRGRQPGHGHLHAVGDGVDLPRWRRPVLAGDQLVEPECARPVVPARGRGLRPEDRAGRSAGAAALGLLEQHRHPAGGDADLRAVHDGGRCRLRRGVRQLGTAGGHDLHGARPLRVPARAHLGCVHAVHQRVAVGRRAAERGHLPRHGLGRDRGRRLATALLVAETPGAPVELRVVEPAIGGVEVGLIGAFEAVVVDDGAFTMLTTAS